jgi:ribosomal protein S7
MKKSYNSLFNSILFEKFNNKLFLKGKKEKYLKYIFFCWKSLKKSKIKPKIFFFLILEKLKPIFFFSKKIQKRKKKKTVFYKPFLLSTKQRYLTALKWLLLPLKKKKIQKFNLELENCFLVFLNKKYKNLALFQKKKTYLIILKYKRFIKF